MQEIVDTIVVHINRDDYDVMICRPSIWGNPFRAGIDGTRDEVIAMYEEYVRQSPHLMESLHTLRGKRLACWCKPSKRCHGDALVKLIKEQHFSKLIEY